jgi:hypothetical protein
VSILRKKVADENFTITEEAVAAALDILRKKRAAMHFGKVTATFLTSSISFILLGNIIRFYIIQARRGTTITEEAVATALDLLRKKRAAMHFGKITVICLLFASSQHDFTT